MTPDNKPPPSAKSQAPSAQRQAPITRIFICGVGGLGTLTTAALVSKASLNAGLDVVASEVHGMSQRGGSVETSVLVGNVRSPLIGEGRADLFIGLEPLEALRYRSKIGPHTTVVVNTERVVPVTVTMGGPDYPGIDETRRVLAERCHHLVAFNAADVAAAEGNERAANVTALGAAHQLDALPFDTDQFFQALEQTFPAHHLDVNRRAFAAGRNATEDQNAH